MSYSIFDHARYFILGITLFVTSSSHPLMFDLLVKFFNIHTSPINYMHPGLIFGSIYKHLFKKLTNYFE